MSGSARSRHMAEFMSHMYPAFSRRATQVCILSAALEKIAHGATDVQRVAHTALAQADAFGWNDRAALAKGPSHGRLERRVSQTARKEQGNHGR